MRNIQYYGSPVRDVVNKNSAEPQAAHLKGIWGMVWLLVLSSPVASQVGSSRGQAKDRPARGTYSIT